MTRKYTVIGDELDFEGKSIVIFGGVGTGKTTLANKIQRDLAVEVKVFDEIRKIDDAIEAFEAREDGEVNIITIHAKDIDSAVHRLSLLMNEGEAYILANNDIFIHTEFVEDPKFTQDEVDEIKAGVAKGLEDVKAGRVTTVDEARKRLGIEK